MNDSIPACPICGKENTYFDENIIVCADCSHEWNPNDIKNENEIEAKDANGNLLINGDSVIVVKDLKVKGSSMIIKKGSKAKNIRLIEGDHNVDCKIDGISMQLKSEFLKKA